MRHNGANNISGNVKYMLAFELIQGKSFVDLGSRGEQSGSSPCGPMHIVLYILYKL